MKYLVEFDRIGRNHLPAPLIVTCDPTRLLWEIERHALKQLASRDIDIALDIDTGRGSITAGFHAAGSFIVTEVVGATMDGRPITVPAVTDAG